MSAMFGMGRPITNLGTQGAYLTNLDLPGRRPRAFYLVGLLLATFPAFAGYVMYSGRTEPAAYLPATYSVLAIVVVWIASKLGGGAPCNWLSGEVPFLLTFCVFHFTYLMYYSFGWVPLDDEVFLVPATVWRATLFCVLSLVAFLAAYELTGLRYRPLSQPPRIVPAPPGALGASKIIIAVCLAFMLSVMLSVGIGNLTEDYHLAYNIGGATGGRFFWLGVSLGVVGLCVYCSVSGLNKQKAMSGPGSALIATSMILVLLFMGKRSNFIYLAIVPALAFHYFQRRINAIGLVLLCAATMFVSTVIGLSRTTITLNVGRMYEEYKYQTEQSEEMGGVSRALMEFGATVKTVVIAMDLVPDQYPYWYGESYLGGFELVVPNVIPGYERGTTGGLGAFITETVFGSLENTHGRGGSIAMEAYVNFGFVGGLLSFAVLGVCFRMLYERFLRRPDLLRSALFLASASALMLWVRNTSYAVPRTMLWTLGLAWLLQRILSRRAAQAGATCADSTAAGWAGGVPGGGPAVRPGVTQ
jgi:hypothetical protein